MKHHYIFSILFSLTFGSAVFAQAADDAVTTSEDTSVVISMLSNDTLPNGFGAGTIIVSTAPMHGVVAVNNNGTPDVINDDVIVYTPNPNFNGNDSFVYTITDTLGVSFSATVTIVVVEDSPGYMPPVATNDTATVSQDTSIIINVLANDSFGLDGPGSFFVDSPNTAFGGLVSVVTNNTPNNPLDDFLFYSPALGFNGVDSFTYTITDLYGTSATATVNVTVFPDPDWDNSTLVDDTAVTTINTPIEVNVLVNDVITQPIMSFIIQQQPLHGTAVINENTSPTFQDNTVTYTPEAGFTGQDSFIYTMEILETGILYGNVVVIVSGGIVMKSFVDSNGNGIQEESEPYFNQGTFHYTANNDGVAHDGTSGSGIFYINDTNAASTYDLSFSIANAMSAYYTVATPAYNDVTVTANANSEFKFAVTAVNFNDVSVQVIPVQAPRPGFTYLTTIAYHNNSAQPASGTVTFVKDPVVSIQSVAQTGVVATENGFSFNFTNLGAFETRYITVTLLVPVIPTVSLGQLLTNSASISVADDVQISNNTSSNAQAIIGSYDPNDITEAHGEKIPFAEFTSDDYLYYTIRFENTGTASAETIRVESTLDAKLDETTVETLNTSSNYMMDRTGNALVWHFNDAMLPPSEEGNDTTGHGFLTYRIKPKPGYAIGDVIPNLASIYFDFNPAIVTNTFMTEFMAPLSVGNLNAEKYAVYPNPMKNTLSINATKSLQNIIVYSLLGQKMLEVKPSGTSITLNVSGLKSGIYLVTLQSANGTKTIKVVKE